MTVSLAEATAAARRVAEMPPSDPEYLLRDFARDVETLKDFVLAGDTERLREVEAVERELIRACDKFGPFNSSHEGYAVILEELDELWEHVKANTGRSSDACSEAIQVAAMALRYARDLCEGSA